MTAKRRALLAGALATSALVCLPTRSARAWVQIALAVVAAASTIVGLLSARKGGRNIGDLVNLQTELLIALSDQIRTLHDQIALVYEQIAELKNMVKELPKEVTLELYRTKLSAQLKQFQELMKVYAVERQSVNVETAVLPRLRNEVLPTVREVRFVFSGEQNATLIPLMVAALQAEIGAMLMIGEKEYPRSAIRVTLDEYAGWFGRWIDPAYKDNLPDRCRKRIRDMIRNKEESDQSFLKYNGWTCFQDQEVLLRTTSPGGLPRAFLSYVEKFITVDNKADDALRRQLGALREAGARLAEPLDRITLRRARVDATTRVQTLEDANETARRARESQGDSALCAQVPKSPDLVVQDHERLTAAHDLDAPGLLAEASFLIIASAARSACDRFYARDGKQSDSTDGIPTTIRSRVRHSQAQPLTSVSTSADGSFIAKSVQGSTAAFVYSSKTGREFAFLEHELRRDAAIANVSLSSTGKILATAADDGLVRIWDVAGESLLQSRNFNEALSSIAYSPDDARLAIGAQGGALWLWNMTTDEVLRVRASSSSRMEAKSLCISDNGRFVRWTEGGRTLHSFEIGTRVEQATDELINFDGENFSFAPDNQHVVIAAYSGFEVWDVRNWVRRGTVLISDRDGQRTHLRAVQFMPDGRRVLAATFDDLFVWDLHDVLCSDVVRVPVLSFEGRLHDPWRIMRSRKGDVVVIAGKRSGIEIREIDLRKV